MNCVRGRGLKHTLSPFGEIVLDLDIDDYAKCAYSFIIHDIKDNYEKNHNIKKFFHILNTERMDKKYLLNQILNDELWNHEPAIDEGFTRWKKRNFPIRLEAFKFHDANCEKECEICEFNKNWSNLYERKRPELC